MPIDSLRVLTVVGVLVASLLPGAAPLPTAVPARAGEATDCAAFTAAELAGSGWGSLQLMGAAALAGQPAWVVGLHTWDGSRDVPIARWMNGAWHLVPSPWGRSGSLNAVAAYTANRAWTVGKRSGRAIAARWTGSIWRNVPTPAIGGQLSTFTDVAMPAANRAWIVGARLVRGQLKPLAYVRASRWRNRTPALPAASQGGLTAVTVAPGGRVWIGGWRADGGQWRPWLLRRNGLGWQRVAVAPVGDGRAALTSLAFGAANDGWLAGFVETAGGGYEPILQRWNGSIWKAQATPWTAVDSVLLHAVAVDRLGRVTVAGTQIRDNDRQAVMATLDGGTWSVHQLVPDGESWMMGAAGLASGSLVVGEIDDRGSVFFTCDDSGAPAAANAAGSGPADSHAGHLAAEEDRPARLRRAVRPETVSVDVVGFEARDVTAAAGLEMTVRTWSSVVGDFNGDGHVDIYLNRHVETTPQLLLGSETGVFSLSDAQFSFEDRHACAAADVDQDGTLDLFCPVGANAGNSTWPHELLLNPADGGGTVATAEWGVLDAFGRGRWSVFLNLNRDTYPDLFVTNDPGRLDGMASSNRLYVNDSGTRFLPAPDWGLDVSMGGACAAAADVDADGDDDLLVCATEAYGGRSAGLRLLVNEGTRFVDRTGAMGLASRGELDVEVGHFDDDGRLDVVALRRGQLRIYLGRAGGGFRLVATRSLGNGVAMAVGDVNRDGLTDIFVAQRALPDLMLVNNGSGMSFTSMTIPQPRGATDDVLALDHDGNGLTDFLSLNGRAQSAGPLMLIAMFEKAE